MSTGTLLTAGRWENYVLRGRSEFCPFWRQLVDAKPRDILFVLGRGFDPRMCRGVRAILELGGEGIRDCVALEFDEGDGSPSRAHDDLREDNCQQLESLFSSRGTLVEKEIDMWSDDGRRRVGSIRAAGLFTSAEEISKYSDVVVDISALPRTLYIPLVAKLLYLVDKLGEESSAPNLHVVVSDDPGLDQRIVSGGLDDEASYIHGFESGVELEATEGVPKVWMPILGEGKTGHFERIFDLVVPDEIAPALPFPCANPRRADDLILEYRAYLFDRLRVEPGNLMHVPEQNPFGVYRQLTAAIRHYSDALALLGGCKVVLSTLSSKLLSVGAVLAAYEFKQSGLSVGIAHVQAGGYAIRPVEASTPSEENLFEVWLTGECYDTA